MSLLFYSPQSNGPGERIRERLERAFQAEGIEICRSVEALSKRLRVPKRLPGAAVAVLCNRQDLLDILAVEELLSGLNTILILPDDDADTLAKAHRMRPRFLAYSYTDPEIVVSVLGPDAAGTFEVVRKLRMENVHTVHALDRSPRAGTEGGVYHTAPARDR